MGKIKRGSGGRFRSKHVPAPGDLVTTNYITFYQGERCVVALPEPLDDVDLMAFFDKMNKTQPVSAVWHTKPDGSDASKVWLPPYEETGKPKHGSLKSRYEGSALQKYNTVHNKHTK